MASPAQINFIRSLVRQLRRAGVIGDQNLLKLKEIEAAMKESQTVEELPGAQASEWIEDLLEIKG